MTIFLKAKRGKNGFSTFPGIFNGSELHEKFSDGMLFDKETQIPLLSVSCGS